MLLGFGGDFLITFSSRSTWGIEKCVKLDVAMLTLSSPAGFSESSGTYSYWGLSCARSVLSAIPQYVRGGNVSLKSSAVSN